MALNNCTVFRHVCVLAGQRELHRHSIRAAGGQLCDSGKQIANACLDTVAGESAIVVPEWRPAPLCLPVWLAVLPARPGNGWPELLNDAPQARNVL